MTPSEFKAWFEGFCEAIDDKPTDAQWKRIKEQVKKISAPVAIDWGRAFPAKPLPATPKMPWWNDPWPTERWTYGPAGSPPHYSTGTFVSVPSNPNISTMC